MKKAPITKHAAAVTEHIEWRAAGMASTSNGSALDEILADRQLFEAQFGLSYVEAPLDSDESDLEVEISEDWSADRFAGTCRY